MEINPLNTKEYVESRCIILIKKGFYFLFKKNVYY